MKEKLCAIDVDKSDIYNMAVVYAWTTNEIKLTATCFSTRTLGRQRDEQRQLPGIIGDTTEVEIKVNGITTSALLDTGSTVSTICESFYYENFPDIEIQNIEDVFELKCADGSNLPYKGAVELEVISDGLGDEREYRCLFLVVNDTEYHKNVPVLLGINILNSIMGGIK